MPFYILTLWSRQMDKAFIKSHSNCHAILSIYLIARLLQKFVLPGTADGEKCHVFFASYAFHHAQMPPELSNGCRGTNAFNSQMKLNCLETIEKTLATGQIHLAKMHGQSIQTMEAIHILNHFHLISAPVSQKALNNDQEHVTIMSMQWAIHSVPFHFRYLSASKMKALVYAKYCAGSASATTTTTATNRRLDTITSMPVMLSTTGTCEYTTHTHPFRHVENAFKSVYNHEYQNALMLLLCTKAWNNNSF